MANLNLEGRAGSASRACAVAALKVSLKATAQSVSSGMGDAHLATALDYGAAFSPIDGSADLGNLTTSPSVAIDLGTLTS